MAIALVHIVVNVVAGIGLTVVLRSGIVGYFMSVCCCVLRIRLIIGDPGKYSQSKRKNAEVNKSHSFSGRHRLAVLMASIEAYLRLAVLPIRFTGCCL